MVARLDDSAPGGVKHIVRCNVYVAYQIVKLENHLTIITNVVLAYSVIAVDMLISIPKQKKLTPLAPDLIVIKGILCNV